jgi:cellulose synthase operon protein C
VTARQWLSRSGACRTAVLVLALVCAGCEPRVSVEEQLRLAAQHVGEGRFDAAAAELRKAVLADDTNQRARVELARVLLHNGDLIGAEQSIDRALGLGPADVSLQTLRGELLLRAGRPAEALAVADELASADAARAIALRAQSLSALRRFDEALAAVDTAAVALEPPGAEHVLRAEALAGLGRTRDAVAALERALESGADDVRANLWYARLLAGAGRLDAAVPPLERVVSRGPFVGTLDRAPALRLLLEIRLATSEVELARRALADLEAFVPGWPYVTVARAKLAFAEGNAAASAGDLQRHLRDHPDDAEARLLLAVALLEGGNALQAEQQLTWLLAQNPANAPARAVLARTQIARGRVDAAEQLLTEVPLGSSAELDALLGRVKFRLGESDEAIPYLQSAVAVRPDDEDLRLDLAEAYMAIGRAEEAVALVGDGASEGSARSVRAERLRVIAASLLLGADRAAAEIERAVAAAPDDASLRLSAIAFYSGALADTTNAQRHAEAAEKLAPDNAAVLLARARLEMLAGDLVAARGFLERVLRVDANSVSAITALAEIDALGDDPRRADPWLAALERIGGQRANFALLRVLLKRERVAEAERLAAELRSGSPTPAAGHYLVGAAYLEAGMLSTALVELREATRLAGDVPEYWRLLSLAEQAAGEAGPAQRSAERAVGLQPSSIEASARFAEALLAAGDTDRALEVVGRLRAEHPDDPAALLLAANTSAVAGRFAEADELYARVPRVVLDTAAVLRWSEARQRGRLAAADRPLRDWLEDRPGDTLARIALAELLRNDGRGPAALVEYRRAAADEALGPLALNNIAWFMYDVDSKALDEAVAVARRAHALAPSEGGIKDTLGWLLLQQGRVAEALPLLRAAVQLEPDNTEIAQHLQLAEQAAAN